MTDYDHILPIAKKLIKGLAAKPGVHFADKSIASEWLAQALWGMIQRGELESQKQDRGREPH